MIFHLREDKEIEKKKDNERKNNKTLGGIKEDERENTTKHERGRKSRANKRGNGLAGEK